MHVMRHLARIICRRGPIDVHRFAPVRTSICRWLQNRTSACRSVMYVEMTLPSCFSFVIWAVSRPGPHRH